MPPENTDTAATTQPASLATTRWSLVLAVTYVLVGLTGAAGLIYQVIWQRYLMRLIGAELSATAVILAVFLGGLSLGYLVCGRMSARVRQPLRAYGWLEVIIGLWAMFFPQLFDLVNWMSRSWSFAPPFWMLVQGTFSAALLLGVPTLCMGGTIPLLTQALSKTLFGATRVHAWVYAVNTAGAFVGALSAGFFLVPMLGLPSALRWTAILNLATGLFFIVMSFFIKSAAAEERVKPEDAPESVLGNSSGAGVSPATGASRPSLVAGETPAGRRPEARATILQTRSEAAQEDISRRHSPWVLGAVSFLSGAYVMTLENVLIRLTNLTFGASSYSFSLVVAVFVLCIALGGFWVGKRQQFSAAALWRNQFAIVISLLALFTTFDKWPYFGHLIRICFQPNEAGFWTYQAATLAALLLALVIPVTLIGCTLPLLFHEAKRQLSQVGLHSGRLFSCNALGCVMGSLTGGILLFYVTNIGGAFLIAVLLVCVSAALASWRLCTTSRIATTVCIAITLAFLLAKPFYTADRMAYGTFRFRGPFTFSFAGPARFYEEIYRERPVRFYKDGPTGTVAVLEELDAGPSPGTGQPAQKDNPALGIVLNGKPDSNTRIDIATLKLCAHLPALCARDRTNALVIGLGTGVTAAELLLYPDVRRVDVAEISPTVVEALPLFGASTRQAHRDPRLRILVGDAFRVLGRSREKWGLIISEPSNPWTAGVDQLFTREFYRIVREHLTAEGVFLQWLQGYAINAEAYAIVLATVREQFKNCYIFPGSPGDLLILALPRPLSPEDRARSAEWLAGQPTVAESLGAIGIRDGRQLFSREARALLQLADRLPRFGVETLDRPRLHYLSGYAAFAGESLIKQTGASRMP